MTQKNQKLFLTLAACSAALCVALGAFGAHGLKKTLSAEMLTVFETAVRYQWYHTFSLFILPLISRVYPEIKGINTAAILCVTGIILFSGSLYILSMTEIKWLGAVTPLGGVSWILCWSILAIKLIRHKAQA